MMRLKLVGAARASYAGAPEVVVRGQEVDVEDDVGERLAQVTFRDIAGTDHPVWNVLERTDGDSAAELSAQVDPEPEEPEVEEEDTLEPPKPKVVRKKRAAPKKKRARKTPA